MLTVKYNERNNIIDSWKSDLESLVTAHEFIEDKTIKQPILTTNSETIIGENEISKYVNELMDFQNVWYCANHR